MSKGGTYIGDNLGRFFSIADRSSSLGLPFQLGIPQAILIFFSLISLVKGDMRNKLFLLSWIAIPFIVIHDTKLRYLLPMFPALSILASNGVFLIKNEIERRRIIYFSCLAMAAISMFSFPQIADSYAVNNLKKQAFSIDGFGSESVGVYIHQTYPYFMPHHLVAFTDYYSHAEVVFLGYDVEQSKVWWPRKEVIWNLTYHQRGYSMDDVASLISNNYSMVDKVSGGIFTLRNPYYVAHYRLRDSKSGPTESILYISNLEYTDGNTAFRLFDIIKKRFRQQIHCFGPICFSSRYHLSRDNWLGEDIYASKPHDTEGIGVRYMLDIPKDTILKYSISLHPETWHPLKGDGVRFRLTIAEGKENTTLYERYIDPKSRPSDRRLIQEEVDVSRWWGKRVNLTFQTLSGPLNNSFYDRAGWGDPRFEYIRD
jgi:hypothetical protein